MKSVLPEWYRPSDDEIADFLRAGTVALDTNVLLALYRVNSAQRGQILDVLEKVGDRLWIPYQVAYEYQVRRLDVASEIQQVYDKLEAIPTKKVSEIVGTATESLRNAYNQIANDIRDKEIKASISAAIEDAVEKFFLFAKEREEEMADVISDIREKNAIDFVQVKGEDPVRIALDELLSGDRIGVRPALDELNKRRIEAKKRIDEKVPPGYKDTSKSDPRGDALIWLELLEYAKRSDRKMIFVTDDTKDDFYIKVHGQTIGPRAEMVREMLEVSGQSYHQTTLDGFLRLANAYLHVEVAEDTISTLESRRKHREREPNYIAWSEVQSSELDTSSAKDALAELLADSSEEEHPSNKERNERISWIRQQIETESERHGRFSAETLDFHRMLAENLLEVDVDEALRILLKVVEVQNELLLPSDHGVLPARHALVAALFKLGREAEAAAQLKLVRDIIRSYHLNHNTALLIRDIERRISEFEEDEGHVFKSSTLSLLRSDIRKLDRLV